MPPISWFSARARINGGMQATIEAEAVSEAGAKNLRDIITGFMALAKMTAGNRPETQALWPEIELSSDPTEPNTVSVSFAVSSALLDALTKAGHIHHKVIEKTDTTEK